ncbi:TetR/AcrR family transcriptional regulator [Roseomonas sp. 18066]|uniref:TetR/AcrR family transcriptional regulator n=1 Tax=Roseomonas sp. 18066 TaxID=2681412 RepID=UPI00135BD233|nr:TetR/AcrR family transcriptional regulator [Roseomonas sp. 18066]
MSLAIQDHDTRAAILSTGQRIMARKGFSAVGLTEILKDAGVPKGSFYHYFASKDAFGEALLMAYFDGYHAEMDALLARPGLTMAERLMLYWAGWRENQGAYDGQGDCQGRCLAVKLGAEVADLSEPMRLALKSGTQGIIARLHSAIEIGVQEGSLAAQQSAAEAAASLYQLWLGSSVMAKIVRSAAPFDAALQTTRYLLGIGLR